MADYVVIHLRGGQTVRLPLRRRGRGVEQAPRGAAELEKWLEGHADVLTYDWSAVDFAYVERADSGAGTTPGGTP